MESAANDCFSRLLLINTPVRLAKSILAQNPDLRLSKLFVKMIEAYAAIPHDALNSSLEAESLMYGYVAEYEEKCGRDATKLRKLAAAKAKAYNNIFQ